MRNWKWFGLGFASLLLLGAVGNVYYPTHSGLVIKSPSSGLVTAHLNGTNGTLTATSGAFSGALTLGGNPVLTNLTKAAVTNAIGSGGITAGMLEAGAATNNIGYVPVNKAGDTLTGTLLLPDGSGGTPSLAFSGASNMGISRNGATMQFSVGGNVMAYFNTTALNLYSADRLTIGTAADVVIQRESAGVQQLGVDAASPVAQTLKTADGSGTDKVGASLTLEGGQSTGTGRGGSVRVRTSKTSTTGSTANAYDDRAFYVAKYVDLTDNVATSIFTVTLPTTNSIGMSFTCTVQAGDATGHFQTQTTLVTVDAEAESTTITAGVSPTAPQTGGALSPTTTLSTTFTVVDAGSNVLAVKCTADTSLTPTYLRAKIVMTGINIMGAGTVINEL